jgi:radical SAM protein with 4Fe4S-binding SPASM domain
LDTRTAARAPEMSAIHQAATFWTSKQKSCCKNTLDGARGDSNMKKVLLNKDGNYRDHHDKVKLTSVIPLSTPFMIYVDPCNLCNIKCNFCFHSLDDTVLRQKGFRPGTMTFDLFGTLADNLKAFPERVKSLKFGGLGEPLLNRRLPDMIAYAKKQNVAEKIVLVTNGTLLAPGLNLKLIEAGLDDLLISVEGVSAQKFYETTATMIDYDRFLSGIRHFYEHKGNCRVYAKLAHTGLDDRGEAGFHDTFDGICDTAYVEYLTKIYQGVDYSDIVEDPSVNQMGERVTKMLDVCFLPFNNLNINVFGNVSPCIFDYKENIVFGNINQESLVDIWNGKKINEFRLMHLKRERSRHEDCSICEWLSIGACCIDENRINAAEAEKLIKYFI